MEGKGGLNAGRPRLGMGFEIDGMMFGVCRESRSMLIA